MKQITYNAKANTTKTPDKFTMKICKGMKVYTFYNEGKIIGFYGSRLKEAKRK